RAAPGYRPAIVPSRTQPNIGAASGTALALEGLHLRGCYAFSEFESEPGKKKPGRIARMANCAIDAPEAVHAVLGAADGKPGEIVNCLVRGKASLHLLVGGGVKVKNSAFTACNLALLGDGKVPVEFGRCQLYPSLNWSPIASQAYCFLLV